MVDDVGRARESFAWRAWGDAFRQLTQADHQSPLEVEDLERLAVSAYLIGRDRDSTAAWARAHHESVRQGQPERAARHAFWLALGLLLNGEEARGGGWLTRAGGLVEDHEDCAEHGYLLVPVALAHLDGGDAATALALFDEAARCAERFDEPDLVALARLGRGQALIRLGRTGEGVALLDEVMVAVTAGEVSPIPAGIAYCAVILACQEIFDVRRAQEWTVALTDWCDAQPDLVPYRGQCLVHRAEILQLHGAWTDALAESRRARERLSNPPGQPAMGMAWYQQAELHRLRGELDEAEEAYRQANQRGRAPQPGLALLRLAQGQTDTAATSIQRVLDESDDRVARSGVLAAYVEIVLAAGDSPAAQAATDELAAIAEDLDAPFLHAVALYARGAVRLAHGDAGDAYDALRRSRTIWADLDAPYEAARARVLLGLTCRRLGDHDTAALELDTARATFEALGAAPDLARTEALLTTDEKAKSVLTGRELEVLALVAAGNTNREIATALVISEHTARRHLQNIFAKLGVTSRAAATAHALQQDLI